MNNTTVLVLRTCKADLTSYQGFMWPEAGPVKCPDWEPRDCCGFGLHGLLWGEGRGDLLNWESDAKWLVVEVLESDVITITQDGGGKVKFPSGIVVYCGDRPGATEFIAQRRKGLIVGGTSTSGDRGTSTSGYGGTSTSGDGGTSTSGYRGTSTSGDGGRSTSGDGGTSASGDGGTSTSGDGGTSTSGDGGTSTSGDGGTSAAGELGVLVIRWYDGKRYRLAQFAVGENGIEPGVLYQADAHGKPVRIGPASK